MRSKVNVVLFGPPGVGKGTQSELLRKNRNMLHVSTGNILREHVQESTNLGLSVKRYMEAGNYVPDDLVLSLVDRFMDDNEEEISKSGGLVFDGFPRTFPQAEGLDKLLGNRLANLSLSIFLTLEHKVLLARLTGRRCCYDCGAVVSLAERVEKEEETKCKKCGGKLFKRVDDSEKVVNNRLEKYENDTLPLRNYYKQASIYKSLDASGGVDQINNRITALIDEILPA